ncbi:hypothetical protein [Clostridium polyendosporum]|nr:hypothetical protein [Clostridium polyendosporum]
MGLERTLIKILGKSCAKAVKDLIEKGYIEEIFEIGINVITRDLIQKGYIEQISQIGVNVIIRNFTKFLEAGVGLGIVSVLIAALSENSNANLYQVQGLIIECIKHKYGDVDVDGIIQQIQKMNKVDELSYVMKKVMQFNSIEELQESLKMA